MARQITKELAIKIVKKLEAELIKSKSKAHDEYAVEIDGVILGFISIRRSSDKDIGHDYVPREIHVTTRQAKMLGQCPWSREDYIKCMREKGHLPGT
ncbi:MAG: hypothetical protein U0793_21030 [Gemmataceae bacterium]